MALVTSKNKAEFDEEFMAKKSGQKEQSEKPEFAFPHYKVGDIVKHKKGFMKVSNVEHKGVYMGPEVNAYGEESPSKQMNALNHHHVGTDEHHLYARAGEYPTKSVEIKKSNDSQFDRVKDHPKYERLKAALGKKGATDALLKELNDAQGS